MPGIGLFANSHIERHFAEERHAEFGGRIAGAAMLRENIRAAATMRAKKIAHVFDNAQNRHLDLLEHGDTAPRIDQSKVLRRRHNDGPGEWHVLRHAQLHIPGAGRNSTTEQSSSPHATSRINC